jgi:hypothetical protein
MPSTHPSPNAFVELLQRPSGRRTREQLLVDLLGDVLRRASDHDLPVDLPPLNNGARPSFLRTSAGTVTCPWLVIFDWVMAMPRG